jgi:tetratricopeptide (TPR) repeat protein
MTRRRFRLTSRVRDNARSYQAGRDIHVHGSPPADRGRIWNVPRPVATFTARDDELAEVTTILEASRGGRVALHGLPGVGKTQLALAWVHDHAGDAPITWRIRAADRVDVVADLAQLADRLDVGDTDAEKAAHDVLHVLNGRDDWVLVYDDATPDAVRGLLPDRGGRVLLTSRSPDWETQAGVVEVGVFTPEAAAAFLDPHADKPGDAAWQLAERLGHLPLALEQARAYCARTRRGVGAYLRAYRDERLLDQGVDSSLHAPVTRTLALALAEAHRLDGAAAQLMLLLARFAPTDVPVDLPGAYVEVLPPPLREAVGEGGARYDRVIGVLRDLALVVDGGPGTLRVHRLVAEIVRDEPALGTPDRRGRWRRPFRRARPVPDHPWSTIAQELVLAAVPEGWGNPVNWDRAALLLPHAQAAAGRVDSVEALALHDWSGLYLHSRGEFRAARQILEPAYGTSLRTLGDTHRRTLKLAISLAEVLHSLGDLDGAHDLYRRTLDSLSALSRVSPVMTFDLFLTSLNNLAEVLQAQGRIEEARGYLETLHQLRHDVHGEDHPDSLNSAQNLAGVHYDQGNLAAARALLATTLDRRRRVSGDTHPATMGAANSLAGVLKELGHLDEARELAEDTYDKRRRTLGDTHLDTLTSANNLANILFRQGDLNGARRLLRETHERGRDSLGDDHPFTRELGTAVTMLDWIARAEPGGDGARKRRPRR